MHNYILICTNTTATRVHVDLYCCYPVPVSTPPPVRAPPPRLPPEPAVRTKRAPIPPKRTSSFNQQSRDNNKLSLLPEPLLETETDFSSTAADNQDVDAANADIITGVVESIEKEFSFLNDVAMATNDLDDTTEQQKSRSSSSELLSSTPGTQSHNGSLERILQRRLMSSANTRERSPPGGMRALNSSGGEVAKTPDTDVSDVSVSSPAMPTPPGVSAAAPLTSLHELPESLPLSHLRDNLRKSQTYPRTETSSAGAALKGGAVTASVASLDTSNLEQVISRYGTMPKTARIGAYLASLEQAQPVKAGTTNQNGESPAVIDVSTATRQMPTPDIRRKVEEWRAGVEKSMEAEDTLIHQAEPVSQCVACTKTASDIEHNGNQSHLFRSSSIHALSRTDFTGSAGRAPISTFLNRGKSDLSDTRYRSGSDHELCRNVNTRDATARTAEWANFRPKPAPRNLPPQQCVRHSPPLTIETSGGGGGDLKPTEDLGLKLTDHALHHQSSSSDEALLDQKSIKSGDSGIKCDERGFFARKFSPIVPKKPIVSSPPPPSQILHEESQLGVQSPTLSTRSRHRDNTLDHKTKPAECSPDTNSVFESGKKDLDTTTFERLSTRKPANVELQMHLQPAPPKHKPSGSPTPTTTCGMLETVKSKFGGFLRQRSTEGTKGVCSSGGANVDTQPEKDETITPRSSGAAKPAHAGARAVLPGSKLFLPGSQAALVSPQQLSSRTSLHHVNIANKAAEKPDEGTEPVSKDAIVALSEKLRVRLEALGSTANKHTSVFLQLTDEVQDFYVACHSYVESLAPHAKFQFREMLVTLQTIAERLKTCTAKDYDRLTAELLRSLEDIKLTLKR